MLRISCLSVASVLIGTRADLVSEVNVWGGGGDEGTGFCIKVPKRGKKECSGLKVRRVQEKKFMFIHE